MVGAERALGHLQLAEQHRASLAQAAHHSAIHRGNEVAMDHGAGRSRDTGGPAQILDRDRHAMQGSDGLATSQPGIDVGRLRECKLGCQACIGMKPRVEPLDAPQHGLRHFGGGEFARPYQLCKRPDAQPGDVIVGHGAEALLGTRVPQYAMASRGSTSDPPKKLAKPNVPFRAEISLRCLQRDRK